MSDNEWSLTATPPDCSCDYCLSCLVYCLLLTVTDLVVHLDDPKQGALGARWKGLVLMLEQPVTEGGRGKGVKVFSERGSVCMCLCQ